MPDELFRLCRLYGKRRLPRTVSTGSDIFFKRLGMVADSVCRGAIAPSMLCSKGLDSCSAQFHLLFSVRFVYSCCLILLRHSRLMDSNGQLPIRRIGNDSITILTCTIRTIFTRLNTTKADPICTTAIRRKCRFPHTIKTGSTFTHSSVVFTLVIISGSIFSRELSPPDACFTTVAVRSSIGLRLYQDSVSKQSMIDFISAGIGAITSNCFSVTGWTNVNRYA